MLQVLQLLEAFKHGTKHCSWKMGLKSFKSMITIDSSYLAASWEDLYVLRPALVRNSWSLWISSLNWNVVHSASSKRTESRGFHIKEAELSQKKERAAELRKAADPVMIAPVRERLTALRTWLLTFPTGEAPPPPPPHLSPGEVDRWLRGSRLLDTYDCQLGRGHRDHFRQILVKEVKKNTKEII